jgi:hypothetical protein
MKLLKIANTKFHDLCDGRGKSTEGGETAGV